MRYINTIEKNECFAIGEGVLEAADNFFFWSPIPNGKSIDWPEPISGVYQLPVLIDTPVLPPTDYELKLIGTLIDSVMCSATAADMWGLSSVESHILAGNDTNFYFENGNSLVLTAANFPAFKTAWVAFRESFFPLP
jgi:hypothetical protein